MIRLVLLDLIVSVMEKDVNITCRDHSGTFRGWVPSSCLSLSPFFRKMMYGGLWLILCTMFEEIGSMEPMLFSGHVQGTHLENFWECTSTHGTCTATVLTMIEIEVLKIWSKHFKTYKFIFSRKSKLRNLVLPTMSSDSYVQYVRSFKTESTVTSRICS